MVILQFNKLIRNKWVWGVFAVLVSAAFCFDDFFASRGGSDRRGDEKFSDLPVAYDANLREQCRMMLQIFENEGRRGRSEISERDVDKAYASLVAFEQAGICVSDAVLAEMIQANYLPLVNNDMEAYAESIKNAYQMDVRSFEALYRKYLQLRLGYEVVLNASSWVSPAESYQSVRRATDNVTARIVTFRQTEEEAAKVQVSDDEIKKWYDDHADEVTVPAGFRLRYVELDLANANLLARLAVTDQDVTARYELDKESKYTETATNGVKTVKAESEVAAEIRTQIENEKFQALIVKPAEAEVGKANALYAEDRGARQVSVLDKLAKTYGVPVTESPAVVTVESSISPLIRTLVKTPAEVLVGSSMARDAISKLNPKALSPARCIVVNASTKRKIWVVEVVAKSAVAARKADLEEVRAKVSARALAEAKQKAFDATVAEICSKGAEEILAKGKVSDPVTFSMYENDAITAVSGQVKSQAVEKAFELSVGEHSELIANGACAGVIVFCDARELGLVQEGMEANEAMKIQALHNLGYADIADGRPQMPSKQEDFMRYYYQSMMWQAFDLARDRWANALLAAYGYKDGGADGSKKN